MKLTVCSPIKIKLFVHYNKTKTITLNVKNKKTFLFDFECTNSPIFISTKNNTASNKTSLIGFFILSIFSFFLETQKIFEKRFFVSYYNVIQDLLVPDACLSMENSNTTKDILLTLKELNWNGLNIFYWESIDLSIKNQFNTIEMKKRLYELLGFWFVVTNLPSMIFIGLVLYQWISKCEIMDVGIILIVFLESIMILSIYIFVYQYKRLKKYIELKFRYS